MWSMMGEFFYFVMITYFTYFAELQVLICVLFKDKARISIFNLKNILKFNKSMIIVTLFMLNTLDFDDVLLEELPTWAQCV